MAEKPPDLVTENVFLDTCIFVAENYNSTAYQTLIRLGTIGAVKLKTTDITLREIKRQIAEKVADAIKSLQAKSGKSAVLRNFEGYTELMEKFAAQKSESLATELWERVLPERYLRQIEREDFSIDFRRSEKGTVYVFKWDLESGNLLVPLFRGCAYQLGACDSVGYQAAGRWSNLKTGAALPDSAPISPAIPLASHSFSQ
jgi:hypothetical protein